METKLETLVHDDYFNSYLERVELTNLSRELEDSGRKLDDFLTAFPSTHWNYRYQEDKWSAKEVVMHLIQTELIFNYRAMTIACENNPVNLPGFDESSYAFNMELEDRVPQWLIAFFKATRQQTILMSRMFSVEQMAKRGIANGKEIQVESLFFISSGHTRHHMEVLRERYLN